MSSTEVEVARPVRNILRDYVAGALKSSGNDVTYAELITGALLELGNDPEFIQAAARDVIPSLMPDVLREATHARKKTATSLPGGWLEKQHGVKLTVKQRIGLVYEGTGAGGYRKLLACSKLDLMNARDRNRAQAAAMNRWSDFEDDCASLLEKPEDILGEAVPIEEVERVWLAHFPETESGS